MEQAEDFLYTPYGLAIIAVVAALLTSLVWTICCCIYCCNRRRHRLQRGGVTEANRDLYYLGMSDPNGTITSGYNTGTNSYSLNSLATENTVFNSSMDSILEAS